MHLVFYNGMLICCSNDTYANRVTWDWTFMPITRASPNMLGWRVVSGWMLVVVVMGMVVVEHSM